MKLGSTAELIRGVTFERSEASPTPGPGLVPILRAGNIGDKLVLDRDLVWVPEFRVGHEQRLRVGDIVICMSSGSASVVGKTGILTEPFDGAVGAFCGVVRPLEGADPSYLALWFRSPEYWAWRDSQARGASIQNLRLSQLAEIELIVPKRAEQRVIARGLHGQLGIATRAERGLREQLSSIVRLRAQVLAIAFQGVAPLSTAHADGASPPGWRWHLLTDIARLESGHTPSRSRSDWWGGSIPWVALPDIRAVDGRVINTTIEQTNAEGIAHSAARVLPAGTVVLSRTASVGFVARMGVPMATSQDFVNWACGPNLDPEFFMHLLIRSREFIRGLSSGATHKTVYFPTVKAFRACMPPVADQRRIASHLRDMLVCIDAITSAIEIELEAIEALPAALLQRAFVDTAA